MKNYYLALVLFGFICNAQVGIGTNSPNPKSVLDLTSTTKGFLPPRMTYAEKTAILSPPAGLQIWCTDCSATGELQVFNGTIWITYNLVAGSLAKPSAPTNVIATALNSQASVAFSPPLSNGGSGITGYTVTSSPGGLIATGTASPIVFSNLNGGTAYTFTVVASSASGNSAASGASATITTNCGVYVATGVWKQFMCYNLGATTTIDPNTPVQGIHGNYYQWGSSTVVANASTPVGAISGWNTIEAPIGAWADATKTSNDPCPSGYRIPTSAQWNYIATSPTLNYVTRSGSWADDGNFTTAIYFGSSAGAKSLTLPTTGYRIFSGGDLKIRGNFGHYWSTSRGSTLADYLYFGQTVLEIPTNILTQGFSVRCISL